MPSQNTIITSTTQTPIVTTPVGQFTDLLWLILTNTSATGVRVDITAVGTGVNCSLWIQPTSTLPIFFHLGELSGVTAGANWAATCSAAVTDIRIFTHFLVR